jgi:hypothetical protein
MKATGRVSVKEVLCVFKKVIDTAHGAGFETTLIDFFAVRGELSAMDLYEIGKTMAEYCVSKSIYPKVARIGKPPLVTGFGAEAVATRGLTSMTFSERPLAVNWLGAMGSKAPGS